MCTAAQACSNRFFSHAPMLETQRSLLESRRMLQSSLHRFVEVARSGSLRLAAERLFVTPSALSRELQKLEEDLGIARFERRARGMALTDAGRVYLEHVQDLLHSHERMRSELDALRKLQRGHVSLLSVEGFAADFLAPAIASFQDRHTGITFSLTVTGAGSVVNGLAAGDADIGVVFNVQPREDIRSVLHLGAPLLAVMAPSHPLARRRSTSLAEIAKYRLALPEPAFGIRRLIDLQCRLSKVQVSPALQSNSLAVLRSFAASGSGITLLSRIPVRNELAVGRLAGVPLRDALLREGGADVCVHGKRKLPVAAAAFLQHLLAAAG
jgi:DNA-binding transcriptional LysR family regulator